MKILLTSVFQPFAVDNKFTRKEMPMDLLRSQIMSFQDIFVPFINYSSYGLHLIANNITDREITVLDFPTEEKFVREIKENIYEYIGVSFIQPNFLKAKHMCELIKLHSPLSKIILGGAGALIPNLKEITNADYICVGDGVSFMQELLEIRNIKFKHPDVYSYNPVIFGKKIKRKLAYLISNSLGCDNNCDFCMTSSFFGKKISLMKDNEIKDYILYLNREKKADKILFVGDENLFQNNKNILNILTECQNQAESFIEFSVFSAFDEIMKNSIFDITRSGISLIWIGVESKYSTYQKNIIDELPKLVERVLEAGISTITSMLLCHDNHTKQNIFEDIEWAYSLNSPYYQYMLYLPLIGTRLFKKMRAEKRIFDSIPLEERHGLKQLTHYHPEFTPLESEKIREYAYKTEYERFGPSMIRNLAVKINGYNYSKKISSDPLHNKRRKKIYSEIKKYLPFALACSKLAQFEQHKKNIENVIAESVKIAGPPTLKDWMFSKYIIFKGKRHRKFLNDGYSLQPEIQKTVYYNQSVIFSDSEETQAVKKYV
ncbi:MAG TPA: cobalamin-dependent protein [bacterium]|nr:cobalamin-dependent protein [bacterium]HPN30847.1 cobalamin-dependent protein [bacterium]